VAHREDFLRKVRTAHATRGFRFLLMLSPCPTGWKSEPEESVDLIRLAVSTGLFPVYEVFDGVRYRINVRPEFTPLEEYVSRQRRYQIAAGEPTALRQFVTDQWAYLNGMAKTFPADAGASP